MHRWRLSRSCAVAAALALLGSALVGLVVSPVATAATGPASHNPIGGRVAWHAAAGGVRVTGWAADPDDLAHNVQVYVEIDGTLRPARTAFTSLADPAIAARYGTGPTPDFSLTVPVATGRHTACVVARNSHQGISTILGCVATPLGSSLTAAQIARHSPRGAIVRATATAGAVEFSGWAGDPDYVSLRLLAVLYVDGSPAATVPTAAYAGTRPAGAGANSAFDIRVPVGTGTHIGCIWIVNIGLGSNSLLGCDGVDTRGATAGPAPAQPAVNKAALAQALTHRGQPYVWGATGPKSFDCSGLVQYSYAKAGMSLPRVSQAQALAARLIPASRVVPGDLVFTHDSEGEVYHVGIYVKPGQAFAAIDTQEGVNYQSIWDPGSTTYGSFTHT